MTPARAAAARSTRSATGRARELLATGGPAAARHGPAPRALLWSARRDLGTPGPGFTPQLSPMRLAESRPAERPRELLAIVIGTGTSQADARTVAEQLLGAAGGSLHGLVRQPVGALEAIPGVGRAKAARVTAALELARRLLAEDREPEVPV